MTLTSSQLRQFLPAVPIRAAGDFFVQGMSIDTRSLQPGNIFVALRGENVDGHQYVGGAAEKGASIAIVEHWVEDVDLPQILVEDAVRAMGELARAWRNHCASKVIAVTGSNGKTTTKQMLGAIFSRAMSAGNCLMTEGNLNNHLGLPLTIARMSVDTEVAILEHGASAPGEIAYLGHISCPDIAIITNAGPAHLDGFGDVAGVARAKGELISALSEDGVAVLNADDSYFNTWLQLAGERRVLTFGFAEQADFQVQIEKNTRSIAYQNEKVVLSEQVVGEHNLVNLAAAVAAAVAQGEDFASSVKSGESYTQVGGRLREIAGISQAHIIDDAYNANPASVVAGIKALPAGEPRWLVLGTMAELGADADRWHREVGKVAQAIGIERVYVNGDLPKATLTAFGGEGAHFETREALCEALIVAISEASAQPWVLVKGSLSSKMGEVVKKLEESLC